MLSQRCNLSYLCTQDKVQDIGRGTLLAKGDIQEVTGKVKSLYDAYPYPPEAVFDGPTVNFQKALVRWCIFNSYIVTSLCAASTIFQSLVRKNEIACLVECFSCGQTTRHTRMRSLRFSRLVCHVTKPSQDTDTWSTILWRIDAGRIQPPMVVDARTLILYRLKNADFVHSFFPLLCSNPCAVHCRTNLLHAAVTSHNFLKPNVMKTHTDSSPGLGSHAYTYIPARDPRRCAITWRHWDQLTHRDGLN